MKEADVVKHLKKVVREMGGDTRKARWEGRKHAPDRLILLPRLFANCWVETKASDVKAREGQLREHVRMRASGIKVFVLDSVEAVDNWRTMTWLTK